MPSNRPFFIGIDTGKRGAVATIDKNGNPINHQILRTVDFSSAAATTYDLHLADLSLAWFLDAQTRAAKGKIVIGIEALPKYATGGLSQNYSQALNFGWVINTLVMCEQRYELVQVNDWCAEIHKGQNKNLKAKAKSINTFLEIFGDETLFRIMTGVKVKKPHDGLIDAYLIAEYMRRKYANIK